ncbi:MAG TPA: sulfatase [Thermoanaerobaculia bacterium]|nr:sulfatase [Thermoanaerobaculia bacterium]
MSDPIPGSSIDRAVVARAGRVRTARRRRQPRSLRASPLPAVSLALLRAVLLSSPLLSSVVVAGCSAPESGDGPSLAGAASGYNVVIVSVDTLRADRLGAWGYMTRETSPEMDRLVTSGVRFAQASAPRALTWPSLATMLTGLYPSGHGLLYNGYLLDDAQPTLPLILKQAGYETAAFLANMCKANHQGWDQFDCAGGVDRRVNREAIAWLRQRQPDRPFLLWVHYFGPHSPYYAGGDLARTQLDPGYEGELLPKKGVLDRVMTGPIPLDDADRRHLDAIYDAAVIGTDRWIGELHDVLEQEIGLERTVIVFLADHGEDLYQHHDYLYHACSVYETSLHVPLAMIAPTLLPAGAVHEGVVEMVDLLPTLLDLLGLQDPSCLHGETLRPLLERAAAPGGVQPGGAQPGGVRRPVGGAPAGGGSAFTEYGASEVFTFREGDWKLVVNPTGKAPICMEGVAEGFYPIDERELYDLSVDPTEQTDLSKVRPERLGQLEAAITVRRKALCGARPAERQSLDEETQRELEALGYVTKDESDE